jgi:hypothetical protein
MLLALGACAPSSWRADTEQASEVDGGPPPPRESACAVDAHCPPGMLCEGCPDGFRTCVPGCREDAPCGPGLICNHSVACLTCPCPSGLCDLDPCRDLDGDGYAPRGVSACPSVGVGDCDDAAPAVHPGGVERCANGLDDDCDGETDARDTAACSVCAQGQPSCRSALACGQGRFCERGCCDTCPAVDAPSCAANECLLPAGQDARGCAAGFVCADCSACPPGFEPVCGRNFSTYGNACLAAAAGTPVLHTGDCSPSEGVACLDGTDCNGDQFCRDFGGGERRCARLGTCSVDADCATQPTPACGDGGVALHACAAGRCGARCP